ncbi:MAG: cellulose binding domain-containing protein [Lachnospiraceae bacterium]|nr:cellulose binding domain-containing protein [Lachnospiraceae bacterium]
MKDKKNLIIMILSIAVVILLVLLAFMFGLNAGKSTPANNASATASTPEPATSENLQTSTENITPEPTEAPQSEAPVATSAPSATEAPTAEPFATEAPDTPSAELPKDAFTLDINTDDNWGESPKFYRMNMVLTNNTDTATNGWTLRVKVGEGTAIDSGWRGKYSLDGDTLIVTNEDHNAKIPAGGSIDFGLIISDLSGDLSYTVIPK